MKTKIFFLVFLMTFFIAADTNAQKNEKISAGEGDDGSMVVATVNIENAAFINQTADELTLQFKINNRIGVQSNIRYAVKLKRKLENGSEELVDQKIYEEIFSLKSGEEKEKKISYNPPKYLKGKFVLYIEASNFQGLPLGESYAGDVTLDGKTSFIGVDANSCKLVFSRGEKRSVVPADKVIIVSPQDSLSLECDVKNESNVHEELIPLIETNKGSYFGKKNVQDGLNKLLIGSGVVEKKSFPIKIQSDPGIYYAQLSFLNNDGNEYAKKFFKFGVMGSNVIIQNVVFDKDHYQANEKAEVVVTWDNFSSNKDRNLDNKSEELEIFVRDYNDSICGKTAEKFNSTNSFMKNLSIPIINGCVDPIVEARIKDGSGNVLASEKFGVIRDRTDTNSLKDNSENVDSKVAYYAIVGASVLALLILLFAIFKKRRGKAAIWIFVFISAGFLFLDGHVFADTRKAPNQNDQSYSVTFTYSINKSSYSQGETVSVSGKVTANWEKTIVPDSETGELIDITPCYGWVGEVAQIPKGGASSLYCGSAGSSGKFMVFSTSICGGDSIPTSGSNIKTFPAPNSPGSYEARFVNGFVGPGCFDDSIPFTVVGNPVNGACGGSNGGSFSSAPTTGLCNAGSASSVTGSGPWDWKCIGSNGGSDASCSANKTSTCTVSSWSPDPSTVCSGESFTQTSNCSTTRSATGTKSCPPGPTCGDGACNGSETCSTCQSDCGSCPPGPVCGNNVIEGSEQCDTGSALGTCPAACSTSCTWNNCCSTDYVCRFDPSDFGESGFCSKPENEGKLVGIAAQCVRRVVGAGCSSAGTTDVGMSYCSHLSPKCSPKVINCSKRNGEFPGGYKEVTP